MIDRLTEFDRKLFLLLNHFSSESVDPVMRFLSGPVPWILFFLLFIYLISDRLAAGRRKQFLILLATVVTTYALTDLASVHLFKEVFERLRPCHEPDLAGEVRLAARHCGGQFGFVSSHAANSSGLAVITALLLKKRWFTLTVIAWTLLISYSRIYLGVHYPGDVLGGLTLGTFIALTLYHTLKPLHSPTTPTPTPTP